MFRKNGSGSSDRIRIRTLRTLKLPLSAYLTATLFFSRKMNASSTREVSDMLQRSFVFFSIPSTIPNMPRQIYIYIEIKCARGRECDKERGERKREQRERERERKREQREREREKERGEIKLWFLIHLDTTTVTNK